MLDDADANANSRRTHNRHLLLDSCHQTLTANAPAQSSLPMHPLLAYSCTTAPHTSATKVSKIPDDHTSSPASHSHSTHALQDS